VAKNAIFIKIFVHPMLGGPQLSVRDVHGAKKRGPSPARTKGRPGLARPCPRRNALTVMRELWAWCTSLSRNIDVSYVVGITAVRCYQYSFIEKLTNRNLNTEMQKLVLHKQYKDNNKENTTSKCQQTTFYTVSQKTSHLCLAITLTHINGFWHFLAEMLPIK